MKIAFVNFTPLTYTVDTPYQQPLGGSESALCYLAEALAKREHQVILFCRTIQEQTVRGVKHLPISLLSAEQLREVDTLIVQNTPHYGLELKKLLPAEAKLVFWVQHATDQPAVACMADPEVRDLYSAIVTISHWQRHQFLQQFQLNPSKCYILRNAIAPAFEKLFPVAHKIIPQKIAPPIMAYTSTPFRGLDRLLTIFPLIKKAVPQVRLQVFSSLKVYQKSALEDQAEYGQLYDLCRNTPGVELIGSLSQTELAQRLKPVLILAYPNTFAETSSIAVMEAMAAGCQIITSRLGALPETTAGFGKLTDYDLNPQDYTYEFANAAIKVLKDFTEGEGRQLDDHLIRQTYFANQNYTWPKRAEEWELFLANL